MTPEEELKMHLANLDDAKAKREQQIAAGRAEYDEAVYWWKADVVPAVNGACCHLNSLSEGQKLVDGPLESREQLPMGRFARLEMKLLIRPKVDELFLDLFDKRFIQLQHNVKGQPHRHVLAKIEGGDFSKEWLGDALISACNQALRGSFSYVNQM